MLYRPYFCCNCGEKIERIEWRIWTSRRFCENCESAFQKEEWIPKIGLGIALIGGLFGFGSFLKSPEKNLNLTSNVTSNRNQILNNSKNVNNLNQGINRLKEGNRGLQNNNKPAPLAEISSNQKGNGNPQIEVSQPVSYCGAQTKKGTACTRKVKGGGRCWQHQGLPAMLTKEKLLLKQ